MHKPDTPELIVVVRIEGRRQRRARSFILLGLALLCWSVAILLHR